MIKRKHQDVKVMSTKQFKSCESVSLKNILSVNALVPILHMLWRIVKHIFKNKMLTKFQVGYFLLPSWKQKQGFQITSGKLLRRIFWLSNVTGYEKVMKTNHNCALALLMFYENRKQIVYKLLGVVLYCII